MNRAVAEFERRYGLPGGLERRTVPLKGLEIRASAASGTDRVTFKGLGAVYNSLSLDLGGFQERIAPGAFDDVLSRELDCFLLWDHDTRWPLAATRNSSLELKDSEEGVRFFGKSPLTSHAEDLRMLMEDGIISDASFAFWVAEDGDEWEVVSLPDGEYVVIRTITRIAELFDMTICAQGAYPAAESELVRKHLIDAALRSKKLVLPSTAQNLRSVGKNENGEGDAAPEEPVVTPEDNDAPVEAVVPDPLTVASEVSTGEVSRKLRQLQIKAKALD